MTITIKLKTDNAAFDGRRDDEVTRILKDWASRIPEDGYTTKLWDMNGNIVGSVSVTGK